MHVPEATKVEERAKTKEGTRDTIQEQQLLQNISLAALIGCRCSWCCTPS